LPPQPPEPAPRLTRGNFIAAAVVAVVTLAFWAFARRPCEGFGGWDSAEAIGRLFGSCFVMGRG
jgi:hypothetical protein